MPWCTCAAMNVSPGRRSIPSGWSGSAGTGPRQHTLASASSHGVAADGLDTGRPAIVVAHVDIRLEDHDPQVHDAHALDLLDAVEALGGLGDHLVPLARARHDEDRVLSDAGRRCDPMVELQCLQTEHVLREDRLAAVGLSRQRLMLALLVPEPAQTAAELRCVAIVGREEEDVALDPVLRVDVVLPVLGPA